MPRMAIIAATALLVCACAPSAADQAVAATSDRDCFHAGDVNGFNVIDQNNVRISLGAGRNYIMTTQWNTRWLNWDTEIVLRSTTGWICAGNGLGVELVGGEPRRTYAIRSIRRETEAPQG